MTIAVAGGPNWTDILTAIGTVGAVVVAVGIALWTERRSDRRVNDERKRSDKQLTEQRALEKAAIEDERAHGHAQLEEERRLAREREQFAEAYAVRVVPGQYDPGRGSPDAQGRMAPSEVRQLAVMVENRGSFTITRVEAQFRVGNAMIPHHKFERMTGFEKVPGELRGRFAPSPERSLYGVLTPWDTGIRFETDSVHERGLAGWYPVVRWQDRWGVWWEHKRGVVRQVSDGQSWEP